MPRNTDLPVSRRGDSQRRRRRAGRGRNEHRQGGGRRRGRGRGAGRTEIKNAEEAHTELWDNSERYNIDEESEEEGVDFDRAAQGGLLDGRPGEGKDTDDSPEQLQEMIADFSKLDKVLKSVPLHVSIGADPVLMGLPKSAIRDLESYLEEDEEECDDYLRATLSKLTLEDLLKKNEQESLTDTRTTSRPQEDGSVIKSEDDDDDFDQWLDTV